MQKYPASRSFDVDKRNQNPTTIANDTELEVNEFTSQPGLSAEAKQFAPRELKPNYVMQLQNALGNRAVSRIIARTHTAVTPTIQRVAWVDQTSTIAALSAELNAGVTLAQTTPTATPSPLPTWVGARVDEEMDGTFKPKIVEAQNNCDSAWTKLPAQAKTKFVEAEWKKTQLDKAVAKINQSRAVARVGVLSNYTGEFKWNVDFNNTDGFLPGVAGAGGYKEYYAAPDPAHGVGGGFWGANRVLRGTGDASWWVTSDHYQNFVKVV